MRRVYGPLEGEAREGCRAEGHSPWHRTGAVASERPTKKERGPESSHFVRRKTEAPRLVFGRGLSCGGGRGPGRGHGLGPERSRSEFVYKR
jgi:hypothetical protein